jgi:hypothetical protein
MSDNKNHDQQDQQEEWEVELTDEEINEYGQKLADWGNEEEMTPEKLAVVLRVISDLISEDLGIHFIAQRDTGEDLH